MLGPLLHSSFCCDRKETQNTLPNNNLEGTYLIASHLSSKARRTWMWVFFSTIREDLSWSGALVLYRFPPSKRWMMLANHRVYGLFPVSRWHIIVLSSFYMCLQTPWNPLSQL